MTDEYLNVDGGIDTATPDAAGALLEAVAETVRKSPDGCRYDVEIQLTEVKTASEDGESG
jgi:hypothetical protein